MKRDATEPRTARPEMDAFRGWLQKEFTDRCRKNAHYSLRAFARLAETDPSTVSQILAGKRRVSRKLVRRICGRLSARPEVVEALAESAPLGRARLSAGASAHYHELSADAFAVIADWYHYAILELSFTEGFRDSPSWIARKLGISIPEARIAIERLERLELLERVDGRLVKTDLLLTNFSEGVTAPALKTLQRQILEKALHAIDAVPQEEKDISSMTMAVAPGRLPEARRLIKRFRRELCALLESGPRRRVYHLGVSLYPVSDFTTVEEK